MFDCLRLVAVWIVVVVLRTHLCLGGRNWNGSVIFPANKEDVRRVASGRLLCLVHTATPSHETRAKTVFETWGKECDQVLLFTDSPLAMDVAHVYFPKFHHRTHSWEKIRSVTKFVHDWMLADFDWFLRADDDAMVFVENARSFLHRFNPAHDLLLGYRWGFYEQKGYADGSTYILSRKALSSLLTLTQDDALCPNAHRAEEDQELSHCMALAGIYPTDSRDLAGRERFHQFHPEEHEDFKLEKFISRNGYYPYFGYPDNVSPSTVGMHHLSPYEIRFIHFLVQRVLVAK